jgi:3-dehydroquinate synthetase
VKLGMPKKIPSEIKKEQVMELLEKDKKAIGQWPRFILLDSLGKTLCKDGQWAHEVSRDMVDICLDDLY